MLISPLMGPIMGVGLLCQQLPDSTIDWEFGVATGVAILSSALYFLISPINEARSELLSRTTPTFLDVMVAFLADSPGFWQVRARKKTTSSQGWPLRQR